MNDFQIYPKKYSKLSLHKNDNTKLKKKMQLGLKNIFITSSNGLEISSQYGNYYQNYDGNYYQNYDGNYNPNYTKEYNDLTIKEMLTLILIMLFVFALIANQYVKICFRKDRHNNNYTNIMRLTQQNQ